MPAAPVDSWPRRHAEWMSSDTVLALMGGGDRQEPQKVPNTAAMSGQQLDVKRNAGHSDPDLQRAATHYQIGPKTPTVVPRNVLEWRCDPASPWRHAAIRGWDQVVVLVCQEGSSRAWPPRPCSGLACATQPTLMGLRRLEEEQRPIMLAPLRRCYAKSHLAASSSTSARLRAP